MKQFVIPILAILVLVSAIFGMVAWVGEINPREAAFDWSVRIATAIVLKMQSRVKVTLPVGVLRHRGDDFEITFEPELPAAKREALREVTK